MERQGCHHPDWMRPATAEAQPAEVPSATVSVQALRGAAGPVAHHIRSGGNATDADVAG